MGNSRSWKRLSISAVNLFILLRITGCIVCIALLSTSFLGTWATLYAQVPASVPLEYQDLNTLVSRQISSFAAQTPAGAQYPTLFSAEVLTANSNSGPGLLSQPYGSVLKEMDSLKALGVKALTVAIHFPVLYSGYYQNPADYQNYLNFYTQVANDVRARGLKLIVDTQMVQPGFSTVNFGTYYSSLTLNQYEQGRAQVAVTIAQQIRPDYLTVVNEPDTEAKTSSQPTLGTVSGSMGLLNTILGALQQAGVSGVPIGAGVGTWIPSYDTFIQSYLTTPIRFINIHVLPVNKDYLTRAFTIANMARAAGLPMGISQAWALKIRDAELGVITFPEAIARNPFIFWEPIDVSFLQAMVNFSKSQQLAFFSPFCTDQFRAYVDFNATSTLSPAQLTTFVNNQNGQAMLAGQYTPVGQAYSGLILSLPDKTPPSPPTGFNGTAYSTSVIHLTWNASTDNVGVAGYMVYRDGALVGTTSGTSYSDKNLLQSTTYNYSLAAYDVAGNASTALSPIFVATLSPKDTTPPSIATNLVARAVSTFQVNFSWSPSTDNVGVAGYIIFRGASATSLAVFAGVNTNSYVDTAVIPSKTYYYAVVAYDAKGNQSALSTPASVTTPQEPPPSVPTGLRVTSTAWNQVNLSWSPASGTPAVGGYVVFRGRSPATLAIIGGVSTISYVDTNLLPNTTYYYAVATYDTYGLKSAQSNATSAHTGMK
jgi:fibronectin type 3 domain-containing protein